MHGRIIRKLRASTVIHFGTASNFDKSPGNTSLPRFKPPCVFETLSRYFFCVLRKKCGRERERNLGWNDDEGQRRRTRIAKAYNLRLQLRKPPCRWFYRGLNLVKVLTKSVTYWRGREGKILLVFFIVLGCHETNAFFVSTSDDIQPFDYLMNRIRIIVFESFLCPDFINVTCREWWINWSGLLVLKVQLKNKKWVMNNFRSASTHGSLKYTVQ